jgi:hypothetical protein
MLKGFTVLAAVAAVVALPAHAEAAKHKKHAATYKQAAYAAQATAPGHRGLDKFPAGPLYYNGDVYMGDDPDPFIRSQLWRDLSGRLGGDSN